MTHHFHHFYPRPFRIISHPHCCHDGLNDNCNCYCVIVIVNKEYQPGYVRHKHVKVHRWLWCWQEQTHFLTLSESFIARVQHVFLLYTFSIKVVPAKSYIMNNQISHLFSTCGSFVLTLGDVDSGDNVGSADFTICSNIIETRQSK